MRAAAIVALMGLPLAGLLWQVSAPAPGAADRFAAQEVITGNGEHARVRLIDGSEVALAPGSRLKVPGGLGRSTREVVLSGEAYFEVAPDSTRPFVVRARDGVTEVLGTEFNVRAYPEEPTIRVVVAEGKVLFRAARSAAETAKVLDQGDLGELESGKEEVISMAADLARDLAWRDGRLTFHETPLGEVARTIERWYGVPIQIADAGLASRRVTASFRHQPVEEVALVIAASLGLDCVRIGDAYVFRHQQEKSRVLAAE